MIEARKRGLSTAELRIHCPVGSWPTIRLGRWPSRLAASVIEDKPSLLLKSWMSCSLPVRKSQPGPAWNFCAYALRTSGVSRLGSMLIE